MHYSPEELMKTTKNTPCCNVGLIRKTSGSIPDPDPRQKLPKGTILHGKFHGNPFSSFCVFVTQYIPTNLPTADTGKYTAFLAKVINSQIKTK